MLRYRQNHDFWHVLLSLDSISVESEIILKWFEMTHMHQPVAALSSFFGIMKLERGNVELWNQIERVVRVAGECEFLMNVSYEDLVDLKIQDVRKALNIKL